jgi:type II secretory ATPase GspE/PulE/Tfp pilus assembly ATPase PilB-like protein
MARLPFRELGFTLRMRAAMSEALHSRREGLILITSPPRSGRSTTLSALLFDFSPYPEIAAQFSRASIVEDVADPRAIQVVHERVVRGECVFVTMIAESVAEALASLVELGFPAGDLRDRMRGALNQRLARRTCPGCQVPIYATTQAAAEYLEPARRLQLIADGADASFVSCRGCWECGGLGHGGNLGVFEWLNPICLSELGNQASPEEVRRYLRIRQPHMSEMVGSGAHISLLDDLREKVLERSITIEEAHAHLR